MHQEPLSPDSGPSCPEWMNDPAYLALRAEDEDPGDLDLADPDDDPPGTYSAFQGLCTGPYQLSSPVVPMPSLCMFIFPMMIAPASRRRSTTVALKVGTKPAIAFEPASVRMPAV